MIGSATFTVRQTRAFIEAYDQENRAPLVQVWNVWMNVPRRPQEACGHPAEKRVRLTAGLNFSVLDGCGSELLLLRQRLRVLVTWSEVQLTGKLEHKDSESMYVGWQKNWCRAFSDRERTVMPRFRWIAIMKTKVARDGFATIQQRKIELSRICRAIYLICPIVHTIAWVTWTYGTQVCKLSPPH